MNNMKLGNSLNVLE